MMRMITLHDQLQDAVPEGAKLSSRAPASVFFCCLRLGDDNAQCDCDEVECVALDATSNCVDAQAESQEYHLKIDSGVQSCCPVSVHRCSCKLGSQTREITRLYCDL